MFNAIFNNSLVISWWSVLLMEKTTDVSQVTDAQHILHCVFVLFFFVSCLVYPLLPISLDFHFLWPLKYFLTFSSYKRHVAAYCRTLVAKWLR